MEKIEGTIKVPKGYFLKTAKADYQNYRKALPREFYQNSIDAGATKIGVTFNCLEDGDWKITVQDDGCGMDKNVLLNHLLVLGGSYHSTEKSVGTFGVAKEILFLSWTKYRIHTQNWIVDGSGDEYTIQHTDVFFKGTLCEIFMPDLEFVEVQNQFRFVAELMETDCCIQVGKEIVFPKKKRGALLRRGDWFDVYFTPSNNGCNSNVSVRVDGVWMFDKWVGEMPGSMIVEISKSSMETLTSNRDGLIQKYETEFSEFVRECISERESILRPKPKYVRELHKGNGKISMREFANSFENDIEDLGTEEGLAYIATAASETTGTSAGVLEERMGQLRKKSERSSYFDMIREGAFIGYDPDFIVKRGEGEDVTRALETKLFHKLVRTWTETVKQAMIDNEMFEVNFRCGFDFGKETTASFESGPEGWIFYINPRKVLSGANHYQDLRLKAVHELSHVNCDYHNETFVDTLHSLLTNTWKSERIYKKIVTQS